MDGRKEGGGRGGDLVEMEEEKGAWMERRKGWLTHPPLVPRSTPEAGPAREAECIPGDASQGSLGVPAARAGLSAVESRLSGADGEDWINCFPLRQELGKKDSETEQQELPQPCVWRKRLQLTGDTSGAIWTSHPSVQGQGL